MDLYELLLFLHIAAAIVWIGSGGLIQLLAFRADRRGDSAGLKRAADDASALSDTLFVPASLAVLVLGILLTIDGPWGLDQLWIVLGLAGYLATFVTGVTVMKPSSDRIAAIMERDGADSPEGLHEIRKLLIKGQVDLVVLYLVVAVMTIKPTGEDVGVLVTMAAIVVAGLTYVLLRLRALDAAPPAASPAAPAVP